MRENRLLGVTMAIQYSNDQEDRFTPNDLLTIGNLIINLLPEAHLKALEKKVYSRIRTLVEARHEE